jgi:hypothetical protein
MMKGCWEGHHSDQSYVWILRHCIFILHRSSLFSRLLLLLHLSLSHSQFHHGMHFFLSLLLEALTNARRCLTAWPGRCNPPTRCPHVGNSPYKSQWLPDAWRFLNTLSTYAEVSWCNCTVFSDSELFLLLVVVGCRDFLASCLTCSLLLSNRVSSSRGPSELIYIACDECSSEADALVFV